jgi:hypothetical protein
MAALSTIHDVTGRRLVSSIYSWDIYDRYTHSSIFDVFQRCRRRKHVKIRQKWRNTCSVRHIKNTLCVPVIYCKGYFHAACEEPNVNAALFGQCVSACARQQTNGSIRCRNLRSIEWYKKTYVQISWDYPFKILSLKIQPPPYAGGVGWESTEIDTFIEERCRPFLHPQRWRLYSGGLNYSLMRKEGECDFSSQSGRFCWVALCIWHSPQMLVQVETQVLRTLVYLLSPYGWEPCSNHRKPLAASPNQPQAHGSTNGMETQCCPTK